MYGGFALLDHSLLLYMVCFWYIAQDVPRYSVRRLMAVCMCDDPRFIAPGFFSFARYRKDLVSLLWISAYVMESYPCSVPPIQSKFLARTLSSLTRWRFCLYELVLPAADGAGSLVRCGSISFTRSPSAKSCFYKQVNFKRWSTGSFYFDSRVLSIRAKIE